MDQAEIEAILNNGVRRLSTPSQVPTTEDWNRLRARFNCEFDPDFVHFMDLAPYYDTPSLLNIGPPRDSLEQDEIAVIYNHEINMGRNGIPWNPDMIPFHQIGNGEYECLSAKEGKTSGVYYVHIDGYIEREYEAFADWIKMVPEYFGD